MKEAGFNTVRLAEFSWIMMEPTEGQFEFDWLNDAVALLTRHGMNIILGTPTAVMPAWVARKYPETLRLKPDGTRIVWGGRKHNCFSNGTYRLLSERITRAMAERFATTSNVIGWQTDNEFSGGECHCPTCLAEFQDWLRNKYGTLGELNRAWGNHFWGLNFTTWGEVTFPDNRIDETWSMGNPSACLDFKRFTSWLRVRFQADQVRILRRVCPNHFVTHNFMGLYSELDYYDLARDLDFVTWDNYPIWSGKPDIPYGASLAANVMRGLKGKNSAPVDGELLDVIPGWVRFVRLHTSSSRMVPMGRFGSAGVPARQGASSIGTDCSVMTESPSGVTMKPPGPRKNFLNSKII
jgi:beta-galactosidase